MPSLCNRRSKPTPSSTRPVSASVVTTMCTAAASGSRCAAAAEVAEGVFDGIGMLRSVSESN
eukprot:3972217-Pleurochrysis_carterae.AAC.4